MDALHEVLIPRSYSSDRSDGGLQSPEEVADLAPLTGPRDEICGFAVIHQPVQESLGVAPSGALVPTVGDESPVDLLHGVVRETLDDCTRNC